jgi:hypothetical protein
VLPRCSWRPCRGLALLLGVPHWRERCCTRDVLQERGAPDAAKSRGRCPWPGMIRPDSVRTLDLDASLAGELMGSSTSGRVPGGAGALGQLGAADGDDTEEGVEAEQQEREIERGEDRRKRERRADRWSHRHMASTSLKPPSKTV